MATNGVVLDTGETLTTIISAGVSGLVPPANVLLTTLDKIRDEPPMEPGVTIFLYQITTNPELRNAPPAPGQGRPRLALELRYLITPWATDAGTSHLICGQILQTLYDHASLVRGDLIGQSWGVDDTVQILLESVPVSEYHHIWEPADFPYRLSLTYLIRVIGIDPSTPAATGVVATATMGGSG